MDRRFFLRFTAAAAAAAALSPRDPAAARSESGSVEEDEPLAAEWRRARAEGLPLVVFVVPRDLRLRWERGELLGIFFRHADDEDLAPLLAARTACATKPQVEAVFRAAVPAGEPLFFVAREERGAVSVRGFDPDLPPRPDHEFPDTGTLVDFEARVESAHRARLAALGAALRGALGAAEGAPKDLDRAAIQRLRDRAPAGSVWARRTECGLEIEGPGGDPAPAIACGMAYVNHLERRFLSFLDDEEER